MSSAAPLPTYPFGTPSSLDTDPEAMQLFDRAPMAKARLANGIEVWLALSHEAVRQVLADRRFSREAAIRPGSPVVVPMTLDPQQLISMDPPRHTRIRRLMAATFSPAMVDGLAPRIERTVHELLDRVVEHGRPADLVDLFTEPLPVLVICELLGVPFADRASIRQWSSTIVATTALSQEKISTATRQLRDYLGTLVTAKRAEPAHDLIGLLIAHAERDDVLTEAELVPNIQLLLVAGHETTTNQLGNALVSLFRDPDQLALLRSRPELFDRTAVNELLRYTRLVNGNGLLPRVAVADVEVCGTLIRSGEGVIPMMSTANRDPRLFPEPERLDVTRTEAAQHLGFGHGTHFCLGAHLARLELRVALRALITRLPGLALAVDGSELRWRDKLGVRSLLSLPVTWHPSRPG